MLKCKEENNMSKWKKLLYIKEELDVLIVSCEYRILIWNKHLNFSLKIICSNLVDKILETISGPILVADIHKTAYSFTKLLFLTNFL